MQKTTIDYLKNLKKNNSKEWFDQNKKAYEQAKADFVDLVNKLLAFLTTVDPAFGNLQAKDCMFRINRDIRFSKDKSPYKTNFGAAFHSGGKKGGGAAFYFHLEPGQSFVGGGLWMPEADKLKKVRQEIDYHFADFKKILSKKDFVAIYGNLSTEDKLKNLPKGYEADNPAAEYLKLKSFTAGHAVSDKILVSDDLLKSLQLAFKTIHPLIDFINRAIA